MTQKEKIRHATLFAHKMNRIADSIRREGDDYDVRWHRNYVTEIQEAAKQLLNIL